MFNTYVLFLRFIFAKVGKINDSKKFLKFV